MQGKLLGKLYIIAAALRIRSVVFWRGGWISLSAKLYLHQGGHIAVGRGVRILHGAVISVLPKAQLDLGDGCILNHGSVVYCASQIYIGSNVRVAHYCSLIDHDYDYRSQKSFDAPKISIPIRLGDNVWLGANVIVLKGVTIGCNSVVGALTLVSKSIPDRSLVCSAASRELVFRSIDRTE